MTKQSVTLSLGAAGALWASGALAQSTPSPPPPEQPSGSPIKTTASFVTRYELREGYRDLGRSRGRFSEGEATIYRARFGLQTLPIKTGGPDVVLQFTPQASGWIGQTSTIVDPSLGLHEGYMRLIDPEGSYRLDVGRFEMNYGDALVIGNLGWHQTARAFEGLRARFSLNAGWVDTFFTQVAEGRVASDPFGAGDTYFYGAYAGLGPMVTQGLELDVYLLGQTSPGLTGQLEPIAMPTGIAETVDSATEFTLGLRAKQKLGTFDYRFEGGVQRGFRPNNPAAPTYSLERVVRKSTKAVAYHADATLGATFAPGVRADLGGLIASGDDPTTAQNEGWNQLYPTAHKFLGLSDVFGGRNNVASANAGLSVKAMSKLTLKAQAHAMWSLHTAEGVDGYTGTEVDTHAIVPLGKGLKLRGMYGVFFGNKDGRFAGDPNGGDLAHYLEVELSFALK